jgi:succinate dehydrogenase hydrophobic anchor subunit
MSAKNGIGPKRLVVGAHYGLRDWIAQRATAVLMAIYSSAHTTFLTKAGRRFSPPNG